MRQPPHGLGISRADLVRSRTQHVATFLSERGIQPEVVRTTVMQLFDGLSLPSDAKMTGTIRLKDIMEPPPQNPWVTFVPPFTGFFGGYTEVALGFRVGHTTLLDGAAGHVGKLVTLDDDDAGDSDKGSVTAKAVVAFWFQAPVAGLVEVIIDAQCGEARHELRVENEWGFSDSTTTQRNLLMMHVTHPNVRAPAFNLASEFHHEGDDDASFNEQHVLPGQNVVSDRLISDGPIAAGERVLIRVGCMSEDTSLANDMEIHSRSTFSWFIKRVNVRILE